MRRVLTCLILLLIAFGATGASAQEPWLDGQVYYLDSEGRVAVKVLPFPEAEFWMLLVTVHRENGELDRYAGTTLTPREAHDLALDLIIPPSGLGVTGGKAWAEYDPAGVRLTVVDALGDGAVSLVLDWEARQAVASMLERVGG